MLIIQVQLKFTTSVLQCFFTRTSLRYVRVGYICRKSVCRLYVRAPYSAG